MAKFTEVYYYDWKASLWSASETRDRLDATGRGIYRELLDQCYLQGSFPGDPEWICRKCACTMSQYLKYWPKMEHQFFSPDEHHFKVVRFENQAANIFRAKFLKTSESRIKAGLASAASKSNESSKTGQHVLSMCSTEPPTPVEQKVAIDREIDREIDNTPKAPAAAAAEVDEFSSELERVATEMKARHPGSWPAPPMEIRSQLKAICNKYPKKERVDKLLWINENHKAWCTSDLWTKDSGMCAGKLEKWLVPSKGRFEVTPTATPKAQAVDTKEIKTFLSEDQVAFNDYLGLDKC